MEKWRTEGDREGVKGWRGGREVAEGRGGMEGWRDEEEERKRKER